MSGVERINLALRGVMELGVVWGLAYWGYRSGGALLALGAPLIGFGFWGGVDFHQAGRAAETMRLLQELAISGLAAAGFYVAGSRTLGWTLAAISLLHHALVYATGNRLLKRQPNTVELSER